MHLIVVGAQKSGTTWLYTMWRQHPQLGFGFLKEAHYFDKLCDENTNAKKRTNRLRRRLANPGGLRERAAYLIRQFSPKQREYYRYVLDAENAYTDAWYEAIFTKKPENISRFGANASFIRCDLTPSYMAMPERGIAHMARLLPNLKPIIIVRDPVKRTISGLNMTLSRKATLDDRASAMIPKLLKKQQSSRGDYGHAIPLLKKHFNELKVIPFKRIQNDPMGILREIENDYGLDHISYSGIDKKRNSRSGRYDLSADAMTKIEQLCAPQYEYLQREFGMEFLKEI